MSRLLLLALAAGLVAVDPPAEPPPAAIHLDQIGFETAGPKIAVLPSDAPAPLDWTLVDDAGRSVASGRTAVVGRDPASAQSVHRIDFSGFRTPGAGYRLRVGSAGSHPFPIGPRPFARLATEAMGFFYQQRSGVPILAQWVQRPDFARAAGHPHEQVGCFAGVDTKGLRWPGCSYRLTTTGGWYDAGDHGKYVVNGGISAWTLLDLHQRLTAWGAPDRFADDSLALPEHANGTDDLLDEARVEVEFLMSMQIPDGQRLQLPNAAGRFEEADVGGLAHTKVADEHWTSLPTAPAEDRQPRFLYPPSTAATLNLAAVAAQAARIWQAIDPAFAARARASAIRAWDAAERHPTMFASPNFTGSGGYGDRKLADERFWAAAELFATTGEPRYAAVIEASPFVRQPSAGLSWGSVDQAGLMTLATVPNRLSPATLAAVRASVVRVARGYDAERDRSGYRIPYASVDYGWGSNSDFVNRALLLGTAWQLTHEERFRDGVVDAIDYIMGRNALDRSYVTGFGARPMRFPHHRFWHPVDPRYPAPPPGVLSGGPNSTSMGDDGVRGLKGRCTGQTCWVDDWRAFTMNEVAINWNAPLVWAAAFLDATGGRSDAPRTPAGS